MTKAKEMPSGGGSFTRKPDGTLTKNGAAKPAAPKPAKEPSNGA
jgi:hypothetical protein